MADHYYESFVPTPRPQQVNANSKELTDVIGWV